MGIRRDDKLCEIGIRQSGDMWRHIFFVLKFFRLFTFHGQCVFGGRDVAGMADLGSMWPM
jgi:hypothetical protein